MIRKRNADKMISLYFTTKVPADFNVDNKNNN